MSLSQNYPPDSLLAPNCLKSKNYLNKPKIYKSQLHKIINIKEMPFYASFLKASYTIEAAIIMPLFITLMVFGIFIFRVLQVQSGMQQSINTASRTMAVSLGNVANSGESNKDVNPDGEDPSVKGELSEAALLASTIALAGVEVANNHVPLEFIDGGAAGINFLESDASGNYIDLKISYEMTFPVGLLGDYSFEVNQRARNRKWVGYDKSEGSTDGTYVYITDHGEVYHRNYFCTYLNPSVHRVGESEVPNLRNKSGGKYYQCKRCKGTKANGFLYVTDYGEAYHTDVNCTEIKHNIKKVLYEEVKDKMNPCSKCSAGEHEE